MSFFDDTKIFGIAGMVAGALMLISALLNMISDKQYIYGVGLIIAAVFYILIGYGVFQGEALVQIGGFFKDLKSNLGILSAWVAVIGVADIIMGIFYIAEGLGVVGGIGNFVIGIIAIIMAIMMQDGKNTIGDKIVWIILLIVFGLGLIFAVISLINFTVIGILTALANIIINLFLLAFLFSDEVKSKM